MYDLFGSTSSELIPLTSSQADSDAPGGEKWTGWISPPGLNRSRADDVHILVNGRPVSLAHSFNPSDAVIILD